MRKVTLVTLYGVGNIGDEAILTCIVEQVARLVGVGQIQVLALSPFGCRLVELPPDYTPADVRRLARSLLRPRARPARPGLAELFLSGSWRTALRALRSSETVVYAGGYWLHDHTATNLPFVLGLSAVARALGRRVAFYGVGAGPVDTHLGKALARLVLNQVDLVAVRDAHSAQVLAAAGVRDVQVTADAALTIVPAERPAVVAAANLEGIDLQAGRRRLGFSVSAWFEIANLWRYGQMDFGPAYAQVAALLDRLVTRLDADAVLFPTMVPEDREACRRIAAAAGQRDRLTVIEADHFPAEVLGLIAEMDLFVGMRLHPLIFATLTGVPAVALAYDRKVRSYFEDLGIAGYCLGWPADGDAVLELAERALCDREALRAQTAARLSLLRARCLRTAELLRTALDL